MAIRPRKKSFNKRSKIALKRLDLRLSNTNEKLHKIFHLWKSPIEFQLFSYCPVLKLAFCTIISFTPVVTTQRQNLIFWCECTDSTKCMSYQEALSTAFFGKAYEPLQRTIFANCNHSTDLSVYQAPSRFPYCSFYLFINSVLIKSSGETKLKI